jgi:hypothetical protein
MDRFPGRVLEHCESVYLNYAQANPPEPEQEVNFEKRPPVSQANDASTTATKEVCLLKPQNFLKIAAE